MSLSACVDVHADNLLVEFNALLLETLLIHALFSKKDSSLSVPTLPTLPTLRIHAKFSVLGIIPYAEENAEGD